MGVSPIAVPQSLAQVLNSAGDRSNVDFDYLLQTAIRESSLDPAAKAPTSSAVGLFQFLESTWLQVMKEAGPRLGYQRYADAISVDAEGDYVIRNKALRKQILALREDPQVAADMAAAFTQSNGAYLREKFGRMPSPGELYIAHFLGPQGAEKLFRAGLQDPEQSAAKLFPKQARANPQIFYADGAPRSIRQLYRALVARHDGAPAATTTANPGFAVQQLGGARWAQEAVPSRFTPDDMSFTSFFATEAPPAAPVPLIATEALRSLVAPDVAAPLVSAYAPTPAATPAELGFVPLPAPPPLLPAGARREAEAIEIGAPQPRILMTNAFLARLQQR